MHGVKGFGPVCFPMKSECVSVTVLFLYGNALEVCQRVVSLIEMFSDQRASVFLYI